jgi:predicted Zn-dependent protease
MITDVALRNQSNRTKAAVDLALTYGVELPHSRKDEDEADAVGIRISYNAAYPTDGIVNFLKRLDKLPDMPQTPEWMSDHPSIQARIERTERIAAEVGALPKPVPLVPS